MRWLRQSERGEQDTLQLPEAWCLAVESEGVLSLELPTANLTIYLSKARPSPFIRMIAE